MARHALWTLVPLVYFVTTSNTGAGMDLFTSKYVYQASESAPTKSAMRILAGSLNYEGGSRNIPNMSDIGMGKGWGTGVSSHVVTEKAPPPKSLGILFFSYQENQFFRGRFDLPYDKIAKLMKEGHYSPKDEKHITYDTFVVGVAPGGAVAVWAESLDRTVEVFFGQAEKDEVDWKLMTSNKMPREEYVRQVLKETLGTDAAVAAAKKNGPPIGLWNRYRTRYAWQPVFTNMTLRDGRISFVHYYNGERDYWDIPFNKEKVAETRPIPDKLNIVWENTADRGRYLEVQFDEPEIFAAFQKLASQNLPMQLEFQPSVPGAKDIITIALRNDKEKIPLTKTFIKNSGAGPNKKK